MTRIRIAYLLTAVALLAAAGCFFLGIGANQTHLGPRLAATFTQVAWLSLAAALVCLARVAWRNPLAMFVIAFCSAAWALSSISWAVVLEVTGHGWAPALLLWVVAGVIGLAAAALDLLSWKDSGPLRRLMTRQA